MDASKTNQFLFRDAKQYTISKEDKFKLVSCSVKGIYCKDILPEINELYAESETARINKEYQKSAELLQNANLKTSLLKETTCNRCVNFFQTTITKTMEDMQVEVHDMSVGFFHKKRYETVYLKLTNFLKKVNFFSISDNNTFVTKKTTTASAEL